jgi:anti-sigma28 factor (negative regulator of flagellin synthesis)
MLKGVTSNTVSFTQLSQNKTNENELKSDNVGKSRVEELKESIKNGTYKVNIESSAKSMAKSLL